MFSMQRLLYAAMALSAAGLLLYPEWTVNWTSRLDYQYYYDADVPAATSIPPPAALESGFELERRSETYRHWILPKPSPRPAPLPPPRSEFTGTGTVELGKRHTTYTRASVSNVTTHLNWHKMLLDVVLLLIPFAIFLVMLNLYSRVPPNPTHRHPPKFFSQRP